METRNNSFNSTDGSIKSSKGVITGENNNSNFTSMTSLVKLERLIYRLNSVLSVNLVEADEFERKSHLKLLLQVIK